MGYTIEYYTVTNEATMNDTLADLAEYSEYELALAERMMEVRDRGTLEDFAASCIEARTMIQEGFFSSLFKPSAEGAAVIAAMKQAEKKYKAGGSKGDPGDHALKAIKHAEKTYNARNAAKQPKVGVAKLKKPVVKQKNLPKSSSRVVKSYVRRVKGKTIRVGGYKKK